MPQDNGSDPHGTRDERVNAFAQGSGASDLTTCLRYGVIAVCERYRHTNGAVRWRSTCRRRSALVSMA